MNTGTVWKRAQVRFPLVFAVLFDSRIRHRNFRPINLRSRPFKPYPSSALPVKWIPPASSRSGFGLRICSGETGRQADPNLNKFGSQFLTGKPTVFIDFRENERTGGLRCLTKMSNLLETSLNKFVEF
jgi:hypothetical protein